MLKSDTWRILTFSSFSPEWFVITFTVSRNALFLVQKGQATGIESLFDRWCWYCATLQLSQHQLHFKTQNILRNYKGRFIHWLPALLFKEYSTICKDALPITSLTEHYIPHPFFLHLLFIFSLLKPQ